MRGPCPEGFHIPTITQRGDLCGILTSTFGLASNGITMQTYLKMPSAGMRVCSSGSIMNQDGEGRYWSCEGYPSGGAYGISYGSSSLTPLTGFSRAYGHSIRPFKDEPVIPKNNWTTLYDGSSIATGAGIFHNATLGLISISGDGVNWTTIADKNVGATQVYNSGAPLSQANCGTYYQRGNNYGFAWSGTVTTSSTTVNASSYGPGNYYNSSTFITTSGDWSSVQNDNLWGAETGVVESLAQVKNIYVGQGIWNPSSNTLLYLPLTTADTYNDKSGNSRVMTTSGTITYGVVDGVDCAYFNGGRINSDSFGLTSAFTVNLWIKSQRTSSREGIIYDSNGNGYGWGLSFHNGTATAFSYKLGNTSSFTSVNGTATTSDGSWHNVCLVYDGSGSMSCYIDNVLDATVSATPGYSSSTFALGTRGTAAAQTFRGYLSRVIVENQARTETDRNSYYNLTKSLYGIS